MAKDRIRHPVTIHCVLGSEQWRKTWRTFLDELWTQRQVEKLDLKPFFKGRMGRQSYCYTSLDCRYWVWARLAWQIAVSRWGVEIRIPLCSTNRQAWAAFRECRKELLGRTGL